MAPTPPMLVLDKTGREAKRGETRRNTRPAIETCCLSRLVCRVPPRCHIRNGPDGRRGGHVSFWDVADIWAQNRRIFLESPAYPLYFLPSPYFHFFSSSFPTFPHANGKRRLREGIMPNHDLQKIRRGKGASGRRMRCLAIELTSQCLNNGTGSSEQVFPMVFDKHLKNPGSHRRLRINYRVSQEVSHTFHYIVTI